MCSQDLDSQSTLNAHLASQHEVLHYRPKKSFKCNLCDYKIRSESGLISHMTKHTGERPFNCTVGICGMTFKLNSSLKSHIKHKHNDKRPFECEFPDCHYTGKTFGNLIQHKIVHSGDRPFACSNTGCNYRAKLKQHLTAHVESVHKQSKPFACSLCDYKAACSKSLKQHMRSHSTTRDFKCSHPHCKQSFKSLADLRNHFSRLHEERNITCDHPGCGRKFPNVKVLNVHKKTCHLKKSIQCPHCDCNFRTNTSRKLARHVILHHGRNESISCLVKDCQYKGKHSSAFNAHMRRHEYKKLVACPVAGCGLYMRATNKQGLKDHAKLHNPSGRPFQCPLCFRHYQTPFKLKMHCFSHTNEKPYKCGHCEFATSVDMKKHMSSSHANIKFPFVVHLHSNDRECLNCKMILPLGEFIVHAMGHLVPVVTIKRMETKWS